MQFFFHTKSTSGGHKKHLKNGIPISEKRQTPMEPNLHFQRFHIFMLVSGRFFGIHSMKEPDTAAQKPTFCRFQPLVNGFLRFL